MRAGRRNDVTRVFGFAIRERDWPLAGLLAVASAGEPLGDACLRSEVDRVVGADGGITFGSLRALGHVLRAIARLDSSPH